MLSFKMLYQPMFQYDSAVSVEALLRPIDPYYTINDVIDSYPSKATFDLAVLKKVILDVKYNGFISEVSINIHPSSLLCYEFIHTCIIASISVHSIITIELIEYEKHNFDSLTILYIRHLRTFGIKIALDDFGINFSNSDALSIIPLDKVKIDGSLISGIESKPIKLKLLYFINAMIIGLVNTDVVFEHVENKRQCEFIKLLNPYAIIQGYFYAKPLELSDLKKKYEFSFKKTSTIMRKEKNYIFKGLFEFIAKNIPFDTTLYDNNVNNFIMTNDSQRAIYNPDVKVSFLNYAHLITNNNLPIKIGDVHLDKDCSSVSNGVVDQISLEKNGTIYD